MKNIYKNFKFQKAIAVFVDRPWTRWIGGGIVYMLNSIQNGSIYLGRPWYSQRDEQWKI